MSTKINDPRIEEFVFALYALYPRKMGKSAGVKKLLKQLKSEADCRDFANAMGRFCLYHEGKETEEQFIPYFSTFVSSWRDWLCESTGTAIVKTTSPESLLEF